MLRLITRANDTQVDDILYTFFTAKVCPMPCPFDPYDPIRNIPCGLGCRSQLTAIPLPKLLSTTHVTTCNNKVRVVSMKGDVFRYEVAENEGGIMNWSLV